jgi:hypothetical protein
MIAFPFRFFSSVNEYNQPIRMAVANNGIEGAGRLAQAKRLCEKWPTLSLTIRS